MSGGNELLPPHSCRDSLPSLLLFLPPRGAENGRKEREEERESFSLENGTAVVNALLPPPL